jgi:hypothetical protein
MLFFLFVLSCGAALAETQAIAPQTKDPELYDHFVAMQETQERLSRLSPEEQERIQPEIRQAELRACQRLRKDRQEGMRDEDYRRQGGNDFVAYALQFEKYCETLR